MAIRVNGPNNRRVTASMAGHMSLAPTTWMVPMADAGWYGKVYARGSDLRLNR